MEQWYLHMMLVILVMMCIDIHHISDLLGPQMTPSANVGSCYVVMVTSITTQGQLHPCYSLYHGNPFHLSHPSCKVS
jgi:hypothetical protein